MIKMNNYCGENVHPSDHCFVDNCDCYYLGKIKAGEELTNTLQAKVEELNAEIARLRGMLNDKDTLTALLSEEEQVWIRMGRFHNKEAAENAKYYCQECDHHNHNGKCGEKLEYDICSEKDLCQCLYSTKTDEDGKRID